LSRDCKKIQLENFVRMFQRESNFSKWTKKKQKSTHNVGSSHLSKLCWKSPQKEKPICTGAFY